MLDLKLKEKCSSCGACVKKCPKKCISFKEDFEGFLYPYVDNEKCINCGICTLVCPFRKNDETLYNPTIIAAKVKHDETRYSSSSGGMFSLLSCYVLSNHGLVCGVTMSKDCRKAEYILIDKVEDLYKLRGSKYIPARADLTYDLVKKYLDSKRLVLFSGVSCQVAGLKAFLAKEYSNLFTIEIVCHGVASNILWTKYLDYLELKIKKKIKSVSFRSKLYLWKDFKQPNITKDKYHFEHSFVNPYFLLYNSELALRPSCYNCITKNGNSGADISLGDFWEVNRFIKDFDDKKGISLVCVNTEKGKELFNSVSNDISYSFCSASITDISRLNKGLIKKKLCDTRRETFYNDLIKHEFEYIIKKYTNISKKHLFLSKLMKTRMWPTICRFRHIDQSANQGGLFFKIDKD